MIWINLNFFSQNLNHTQLVNSNQPQGDLNYTICFPQQLEKYVSDLNQLKYVFNLFE